MPIERLPWNFVPFYPPPAALAHFIATGYWPKRMPLAPLLTDQPRQEEDNAWPIIAAEE